MPEIGYSAPRMSRGRVGSVWVLVLMVCSCSADPGRRGTGARPVGGLSSVAGRASEGAGNSGSSGAAAAAGQGFGNADSGAPSAAGRAGAAPGTGGAGSSVTDAAVDGGSLPSACGEPAPEPA